MLFRVDAQENSISRIESRIEKMCIGKKLYK